MDGAGLRFGPYRTERLLGRGGMGQVYLARGAAGRPVALKAVHSFLARDPEFRARFRREVAAARAVVSPAAAALLDADADADRPWLASEYIDGPTLGALLRSDGPLDEPRLRALAGALATALGAIHAAGLVHRDLKPSNVLLAEDGPRVIDFGIARAADATRLTSTGMLLGTVGYAAPEQLARGVSAPPGDVFALGAVLATAATGRRPFGDGPPHTVAYRTVHAEPDLSGVPENLLPLIAACLAKDPARRPAPAAVLAVREEPDAERDWPLAPPAPTAAVAAPPIPALPPAAPAPAAPMAPPPALAPPVPRTRRPVRGRAALAATAVVVCGSLLAVLAVLTTRGGDGGSGGGEPPAAGAVPPSSSPDTDPARSGADRELPRPASLVPGVTGSAGEWSINWDNLSPEPEAGEDVNEVRGAKVLGAWLTDDAVIRANEHDVRAYDLADGHQLWKAKPPKPGLVPCAMSRTAEDGIGAVAFGRTSQPQQGCDQLVALRLKSGQTAWRTGLRPPKRVVERAVTRLGVADGRVVAHSYSGLVGYHLRDGRALWLHSWRKGGCSLSDSLTEQAVVAVVSVCRSGSGKPERKRVRQLNAADGTARWSTDLDEDVVVAGIQTAQPVSVQLSLRDSRDLPLQVFGPDGTAHPPLDGEQPFGTLVTSTYGAQAQRGLLGWRSTVATTYYTGAEDDARFGVVAVDTRTGKVRWHREVDSPTNLYGLDNDGVLITGPESEYGKGEHLLRMDLEDGDSRDAGIVPTRTTGPIGVLRASGDTMVVFPALDIAEGAAVLTAPDA